MRPSTLGAASVGPLRKPAAATAALPAGLWSAANRASAPAFTEADGAPTVTNGWSKALVPSAGIAATRRVPALAALYAATAASSAGKALAGVAPAVAWA